ncbi:DUF3040 domain-containing protein [Corynebacterium lujinxingii]|uniref:DUF3040 domain-containing protein n=1 Tax=Corynebacterium lujinxingii TaxID=2763010 RepID=A0A7H0JX73_9CORY|nr:DUF3040 domain-containing protein [Corynebacterium lujinxingii]MBC3177934.1 DUF3040 domain-containing protein [Corynebacterium lujinxingii]NNO09822.1 DUF3040 domain-containing protein [Corynebacterium lujinxingii]QNP89639.1 DUF3040 domain-containing protein [Corynebacterium lujinxingii]
MALSEQEMRALREIEQSLLADDPKFGASVAPASGGGATQPTGRLTMRSFALIVLGLVLLLGGVALASMSLWTVLLSIVGFGVMLYGGIMALRTPAKPGGAMQNAQSRARTRSPRSMSMEENFRRRFEDRQ